MKGSLLKPRLLGGIGSLPDESAADYVRSASEVRQVFRIDRPLERGVLVGNLDYSAFTISGRSTSSNTTFSNLSVMGSKGVWTDSNQPNR